MYSISVHPYKTNNLRAFQVRLFQDKTVIARRLFTYSVEAKNELGNLQYLLDIQDTETLNLWIEKNKV
jgi:hypothetical protein